MTAPLQGRDPPAEYEFCIRGRLDSRRVGSFDSLTLTHQDGTTTLRGTVVDQAALHGILSTFRDLGLTVVSMRTLDHPQP